MSNITLYRHPLSGHSHRVELFLSILNIDAEIQCHPGLPGQPVRPEPELAAL